jgi:secernin
VIFAKNSDRPPNEASRVQYYPARTASAAPDPNHTHRRRSVRCTNISIPDVDHTYACLLVQPYWCWGAEMGVYVCATLSINRATQLVM